MLNSNTPPGREGVSLVRPSGVVFSLGIVLLISGLLAYYGVICEVQVGAIACTLLVWVGLFILTPFFLAGGACFMLLPEARFPSSVWKWPKGVKAWSIELLAVGFFFFMVWVFSITDPSSFLAFIFAVRLVGAGVFVGLFGISRWVFRKLRGKIAVEILPRSSKEP